MNKQLYSNLAEVFSQDSYYNNRVVLWRSNEEESFLRTWLSSSFADESIETKPSSVNNISDIINLKDFVSKCSTCGSSFEKKIGVGTGTNGIMIILHAPRLIGKIEMQRTKKDSVTMLKQIIASLNVSFSDCFITNMIKCESTDSFTKPSEMAANCLSILEKEINIIKPKIVLVMGEMQPLRRIVNGNKELSWFTIEHPITMVKNPELKRSAWETLKTIMAKIKALGLN